ncbi:MAG: hypothetical protein ACFCU7_14880 [Pleurocapsa sp.]
MKHHKNWVIDHLPERGNTLVLFDSVDIPLRLRMTRASTAPFLPVPPYLQNKQIKCVTAYTNR